MEGVKYITGLYYTIPSSDDKIVMLGWQEKLLDYEDITHSVRDYELWVLVYGGRLAPLSKQWIRSSSLKSFHIPANRPLPSLPDTYNGNRVLGIISSEKELVGVYRTKWV